jgi:hypothetical protein
MEVMAQAKSAKYRINGGHNGVNYWIAKNLNSFE